MTTIDASNDPRVPSVISRDRMLCLSGVGLEREHNEDACGFAHGGVIVVSDGMGGHPAGELASQAAVHASLAHVDAVFRKASTVPSKFTLPSDKTILTDACASASRAVNRLAAKHGVDGALPGCTIIMAIVRRDRATIAHIGDSRGYVCLRNRGVRTSSPLVRAVTTDHAVDHMLTRCLGGRARSQPEPDITVVNLFDGDSVMLCTDGLTGCVSDALIETTWIKSLVAHDRHDAFARALYEACLADGAHDNVTIALAGAR